MPDAASERAWIPFTFGEMAEQIAERIEPTPNDAEKYVGLEHLDSGSLTVRRWGSEVALIGTKLRMRKRDILFARRNAYLRRVALAPHDGLFSAHGMVLRARPAAVLPEFLPFFMQSDLFMDRAEQISVGSLSPTINWGNLKKQQFALPPLEEQRQMAELLLASEACGQFLKELASRHESLRQVAIDRLTDDAQSADARVGEICRMQNGRAFPGAEYRRDGTRLLRPGNLAGSGYISWAAPKTVCLPSHWLSDAIDFVIDKGDVVMNLTAQSLEEGFMGRVCLARSGDKSLLNQRIGRFRDFADGVLPEYLFRVFQTSKFQRHAIEMCEGSKVKHLFWPYIARFTLKLPSINKQRFTIDSLRQVDSLLVEISQRIESHRSLHRLLLEKISHLPEHGMTSVVVVGQ